MYFPNLKKKYQKSMYDFLLKLWNGWIAHKKEQMTSSL